MFDNNLYNLMTQMLEEHKSLYRIKNMYIDDSEECEECREFWEKLEKDKEDNIKELQDLISPHLAKTNKKQMYYQGKGERKATSVTR